jgi:hypothetical protein
VIPRLNLLYRRNYAKRPQPRTKCDDFETPIEPEINLYNFFIKQYKDKVKSEFERMNNSDPSQLSSGSDLQKIFDAEERKDNAQALLVVERMKNHPTVKSQTTVKDCAEKMVSQDFRGMAKRTMTFSSKKDHE